MAFNFTGGNLTAPISPPPRRMRVAYTPSQLHVLDAVFHEEPYPNIIQRRVLAKRIGITQDQVKVGCINNIIWPTTPGDDPVFETTPRTWSNLLL